MQLVQAAEIPANAITPFQAKNDRRVPGLKRCPDLGSRHCQLDVRIFGFLPNPVELLVDRPPWRAPPPSRSHPVTHGVRHHGVDAGQWELLKEEGRRHSAADSPPKDQ